MNELLKKAIEEIMEKNYHHKNSEGIYSIDIYADYRDSLEKNALIEIGKESSENVREEFYSKFRLDECIFSEEDSLCSLIEKGLEHEVDREIIMEWISENVLFNFPYDHYLNQTVCVNVSINTGEDNYDFTMNNLLDNFIEKNWRLADKKSSLVWLIKQQGYDRKQVAEVFKNSSITTNEFLKSVYEEVENTTTHMNRLVFFVEMTLGQYIDLKEEPRDFIVKKSTRCGLVDFWNGAGSILDVKLDKSVLIPASQLDIHIDGAVGYSVSEIYGVMNTMWKKTA